MAERETFGSRLSWVMAMAGSAIGLGNIWRFPYVVGENGGAAFIILYMASCLVLALPIFFAEAVIGRHSRLGPYGSMRKLSPGTFWVWLGRLTVVLPLLILGYYSVVGGWSVEYLFKSLAFDFSGVSEGEVTGFFGQFISSSWEPLITHTVFIALCAGIVLGGVRRGIERFSKVCLPLLFVLIVAIVVYSLTLQGSMEGVRYMVRPDFSALTVSSVTDAMGQAFFSLSLGVGTVLTYASYMRKEDNLFASGMGTALSDLLFALLSGFAVMPVVFAAGLSPEGGPGLVFQTLPYIFFKMGGGIPWLGAVVSIVFFVTILVAALTSAISMMEVGVGYLVEEKGLSRRRAVLLVTVFTWLIGVLCSLSFGSLSGVTILGHSLFDALDTLCSNILMPLGGLLFTIYAGWVLPEEAFRRAFVGERVRSDGVADGASDAVETTGVVSEVSTVRPGCSVAEPAHTGISLTERLCPFVRFLIRYIAPAGILAIFLAGQLG